MKDKRTLILTAGAALFLTLALPVIAEPIFVGSDCTPKNNSATCPPQLSHSEYLAMGIILCVGVFLICCGKPIFNATKRCYTKIFADEGERPMDESTELLTQVTPR